MKKLWLLIAAVSLTACSSGPSETDIQTAIAETEEARPTATFTPEPTAIPLSDLEELLVVAGDLPAGMSPAQVRSSLPGVFDGIREADFATFTIYQIFEKGGEQAGGVSVLVFDDEQLRGTVYEAIVDSLDVENFESSQGSSQGLELADVGDKAYVGTVSRMISGISFDISGLVFQRCTAITYIFFSRLSDLESIKAYALRLDSRIEPIACSN